ncbi:MAG: hypothetical protein A3D24_02070 [Candidatus Blackburnbacteria bacterium RIFCSPHIGHO2_02_FULL_39_13]|uniref:Uncharacterized protein n=1 Tax=Candidatus Blackburnbacteria bacterium RIFCSPLOWO2_01_FULL_40_20 TaxID=1797519 RepID=A0A1G1VDR5_9BACT|nr:MAG: hypothetical protein UT38_C0001G0024 [Microgenomates group bacterium GW2011_GWA2_39_19]OGY06925.1 MAG: hypothetical protein A2694_04050 [Candidatus Blackburnbacteria bacterium RIFCSPHIGHO2_01_FULL_40_17]OGY09185.1 MAG: hypothetical protein A3D24_02070 [Candidatus Blackburnbacteria bacterium RIFCSPHIGHO2_02_FULL_39_13]OGY13578.1 MAG: hypothetical protein A3A77_04285 [Candidatus Blackburnbacteria bacterium RIFCSPLOWO2_01_FULL_40_20]HBL52230.1 hypothetical protein [Candidatus Blackburnbact
MERLTASSDSIANTREDRVEFALITCMSELQPLDVIKSLLCGSGRGRVYVWFVLARDLTTEQIRNPRIQKLNPITSRFQKTLEDVFGREVHIAYVAPFSLDALKSQCENMGIETAYIELNPLN